jgi:hypothetical protein
MPPSFSVARPTLGQCSPTSGCFLDERRPVRLFPLLAAGRNRIRGVRLDEFAALTLLDVTGHHRASAILNGKQAFLAGSRRKANEIYTNSAESNSAQEVLVFMFLRFRQSSYDRCLENPTLSAFIPGCLSLRQQVAGHNSANSCILTLPS